MAGHSVGLCCLVLALIVPPEAHQRGVILPIRATRTLFTTANNDCGLRLCRVYAKAPLVTTTTRSTRPGRGAHELSCRRAQPRVQRQNTAIVASGRAQRQRTATEDSGIGSQLSDYYKADAWLRLQARGNFVPQGFYGEVTG